MLSRSDSTSSCFVPITKKQDTSNIPNEHEQRNINRIAKETGENRTHKNGNGKTGRYDEIKSVVGGWLEMIGAKAMQ